MNNLQYPLAPPRDKELAKLLAAKFIARPDVFAVQRHDIWMPVVAPKARREDPDVYVPIKMNHLLDHIHGRASYGHYLLNDKGQCKFFAFDIDFEKADPKENIYFPVPGPLTDYTWPPRTFVPGDPRALWKHPGISELQRKFLIYQLRTMAHKLARAIIDEFEIPAVITYSGNKGMHVYGLTGLIDANEARDGALIILESLGCFEPYKGNNFFRHKQSEVADPIEDYPQLSIEIFPKQASLDGKKLGNLMRLPTGRNLKGGESFFVDGRVALTQLEYRDPIEALNTAIPWA